MLCNCAIPLSVVEAGSTGSVAAAAGASLMIKKSTMLNHDHGAAFILRTHDCLYYNVLSGVKV